MKSTVEVAALISHRELILQVDAQLHDLRDKPEFQSSLDPDGYTDAQSQARELRQKYASDGSIVYPSVRYAGGETIAAFWLDVLGIPEQARQLCYRRNGSRVDVWLNYSEERWRPIH